MIAIQAIRQPTDWRSTINWNKLAGLAAILVLFATIVIYRSTLPQQEAGSGAPPLPPGETATGFMPPTREAGNSQTQPLPTEQNIPSPTSRAILLTPTTIEDGRDSAGLEAFPAGAPVEIALKGPDSQAMSENANPFLLQVDVRFSGPDGQEFLIPAFYDGDGAGGMDGNVWKVRFTPDAAGTWHYTSTSSAGQFSDIEGSFLIETAEECQAVASLRCKGQLDFNGSHYLRFKNGEYWVKGGVDDPENFLGKAFGGWQEKKEVLDYLASQGVNSIYVITNNIDGDGKDTWPWFGSTPQEAKQNSNRFDTAKLAQWEDFFSYAETKGIVLHIVLNDDSAWNEYDHKLYYREMIARFGHHPGIIWNLGEEANEIYNNDEQVELAKTLRAMDPYRHPVTVHRRVSWPFLGNPHFDLTSIQAGEGAQDFSEADLKDYNRIVNNHREKSASAGRPIPIMIDETPGIDRVDESIRRKVRAQLLYPIFLGGGNFELHFRDSFVANGLGSLLELEPLLEDMRRAREFLESLPFQTMSTCNELVSGQDVFCFGAPGRVYALYLSRGGSVGVDLSRMSGPVRVTWFDPRTGNSDGAGSVQGGGEVSFTAPNSEDWVLKLEGSGSAACSSNRMAELGSTVYVSARAIPSQLLAFQIFVPVVTLCD